MQGKRKKGIAPMVFSSITFLFLYLPLVLILYLVCPKRLRNLLLLLASVFFYAWGERVYVWILLFSTVFDYVNGILIGRFQSNGRAKAAKAVLALSVVGNLGILCLFKYSDFLLSNLNRTGLSLPMPGLALPIGISFYTFQTMSYTIDVYRGEVAVQKNIISFGTYVTMFPQLIAGPIVRYKTVEQELSGRRAGITDCAEGVQRFVVGLGKKVLLANAAGAVWEEIAGMSGRTAALAWLGAVMFMFQIYFDFSGYTDMAIGLGRIFGFHFPENFRYPYTARSITDFWRRWHITLSTWFREYVYIPLGGNRCSKAKQIRNLFLVWALTGIWHGAAWNFLLWGLYFFVLLVGEKFVYGRLLEKAPAPLARLYTLLLLLFGWVLFANESLPLAGTYLKSMFCGSLWSGATTYLLLTNWFLLVLLVLGSTELPKRAGEALLRLCGGSQLPRILLRNLFLAAILLLSVAALLRDSYNPFLYFRF